MVAAASSAQWTTSCVHDPLPPFIFSTQWTLWIDIWHMYLLHLKMTHIFSLFHSFRVGIFTDCRYIFRRLQIFFKKRQKRWQRCLKALVKKDFSFCMTYAISVLKISSKGHICCLQAGWHALWLGWTWPLLPSFCFVVLSLRFFFREIDTPL